MCGIVAIAHKNKKPNEDELKFMCNTLRLRGPDDEGIWIGDDIGLGHRRLSVIDLDTGSQPMHSNDGSVVIVFNGEIYNFSELRSELVALNQKFRTQSDTEVILNGYQQYGIDGLLNRLEGMFVFVLYNKVTRDLVIARDKFGEKPLYYIDNGDSLYIASELKALELKFDKKIIDKKGLNFFLSLSYIPAPHTIYNQVKKLSQAHYILVEKGGTPQIKKYYDLRERIAVSKYQGNFKKSCNDIRNLLKESVKKRMIADVPVGAFLSGGIDSSIIAVLMADISKKPINTFSIGFKEKGYDESHRAQLIADKIKSNHKVHYLNYKDVVNILDEIVLHYDEPFGDSSALPSYYVAKLAKEKVTVALTGDCADELFGGYEKYLTQEYVRYFKKLPKAVQILVKKLVSIIPHSRFTNSVLRRVKKVLANVNLSDFEIHYNLMCLGFNDSERLNLLQKDFKSDIKNEIKQVYDSFPSSEPLTKSFYTDLQFVVEGDMLTKLDRVSMKNSLEARVPFLDSKLVEMAFSLPVNFKIRKRDKKIILKEAFKNDIPSKTINYRKKGFGVPVDYWFRNELKSELKDLLSKDKIDRQGIFKYEKVKTYLDEHLSGKENNKGKLWNLFVFQKWYLKHIEKI